jgi:hypothetical protein
MDEVSMLRHACKHRESGPALVLLLASAILCCGLVLDFHIVILSYCDIVSHLPMFALPLTQIPGRSVMNVESNVLL